MIIFPETFDNYLTSMYRDKAADVAATVAAGLGFVVAAVWPEHIGAAVPFFIPALLPGIFAVFGRDKEGLMYRDLTADAVNDFSTQYRNAMGRVGISTAQIESDLYIMTATYNSGDSEAFVHTMKHLDTKVEYANELYDLQQDSVSELCVGESDATIQWS